MKIFSIKLLAIVYIYLIHLLLKYFTPFEFLRSYNHDIAYLVFYALGPISSMAGAILFSYIHKQKNDIKAAYLYVAIYALYNFREIFSGVIFIEIFLIVLSFYLGSEISERFILKSKKSREKATKRSIGFNICGILVLTITTFFSFFAMFCGMAGPGQVPSGSCSYAMMLGAMLFPLNCFAIFSLLVDMLTPFIKNKYKIIYIVISVFLTASIILK